MPIALAAVALILAVAGAGGLGPPRTEAAHGEPQGFGASTRGGGGKPRYHVTTLANAGPGSLRDAISSGNRLIVFTVAGTIALESPLHVRGAFLTIDGGTAPSPGITIARHGLTIRGSDGSHDVIVRSLRIRGSATRET